MTTTIDYLVAFTIKNTVSSDPVKNNSLNLPDGHTLVTVNIEYALSTYSNNNNHTNINLSYNISSSG